MNSVERQQIEHDIENLEELVKLLRDKKHFGANLDEQEVRHIVVKSQRRIIELKRQLKNA